MITLPLWLFGLLLGVIGALALGLLFALVKSEELADRHLARELAPPRLNPQSVSDEGEARNG